MTLKNELSKLLADICDNVPLPGREFKRMVKAIVDKCGDAPQSHATDKAGEVKCPHYGDGIQSNDGCPGSVNTRHCPEGTDEDCNIITPAPVDGLNKCKRFDECPIACTGFDKDCVLIRHPSPSVSTEEEKEQFFTDIIREVSIIEPIDNADDIRNRLLELIGKYNFPKQSVSTEELIAELEQRRPDCKDCVCHTTKSYLCLDCGSCIWEENIGDNNFSPIDGGEVEK